MTDPIRMEDIRYRHFEGMRGECFTLFVGELEVQAELVGVTTHGPKSVPGATREPFSLVFKLDQEVATRPGVHRVEHENFGPMELLMTPLRPDRDGSYFEVVFG